jgi:hypothetical protein
MTMLTRSKNAFVLAALLSTASAPFTTQVFAADYGLGWARGNAMNIQQSTKEAGDCEVFKSPGGCTIQGLA